MTVTIPNKLIRQLFKELPADFNDKLYNQALKEYEKHKWRGFLCFKKAIPLSRFWGEVKNHPYPRLCYPDSILAIDYILWATRLMDLVKSGADIHLQYDEEKDEIYPFKRFWGVNLLERLESYEI
jgi:hypothetical protein